MDSDDGGKDAVGAILDSYQNQKTRDARVFWLFRFFWFFRVFGFF